MERVLIGSDDSNSESKDENTSADMDTIRNKNSRTNPRLLKGLFNRNSTPLISRLISYMFITYWLVFALAIWLYYVGTCVGNDCFVLAVYPPIIQAAEFTEKMNLLRVNSPGIVNYSFFPFALLWTITGVTAFYIGFGNWRSNVIFVVSLVAMVFTIAWIYIGLNDVSELHYSITVWLFMPMILGSVLISSYLTIWFKIRLIAPDYARQAREFIGAIGAFGVQVERLHDNELLSSDLHAKTLSLKNLGEISALRERKNEIREQVNEWVTSPDLMTSRTPAENSLVESAAALGCLADLIPTLVSGPYNSVRKVPHVMALIEKLTKTIVMELTFIANEYRTTLRSSLAEIGTLVDDLGNEHEQGSIFVGGTVLSNPMLISSKARDVLLRSDPESWSKYS